jgi:hypothetical protein
VNFWLRPFPAGEHDRTTWEGAAMARSGRSSVQGPDRAGVADQIAGVALFPLAVARRVLPDRELPVYLGVGALAAVGAVEWPVAVAAGLGYAALKRWGPGSASRSPEGGAGGSGAG